MDQFFLQIFTDGACSGNPGPGGWAALIKSPLFCKEVWGYEEATTNNRMELIAVIKGLEAVVDQCCEWPITLVSDSQYVIKGATEWVKNWQSNGWKTSQKKPVENRDLWEKLTEVKDRFTDLSWQWVRGHSGHKENEAVDGKAQWAMHTQQRGESLVS
jgi:ribonuclease HI